MAARASGLSLLPFHSLFTVYSLRRPLRTPRRPTRYRLQRTGVVETRTPGAQPKSLTPGPQPAPTLTPQSCNLRTYFTPLIITRPQPLVLGAEGGS